MKKKPTISQFGDHGILLRYPEKIDHKIHKALTQYTHFLSNSFSEIIDGFTIAYHESAFYLKPDVSVDIAIELFVRKFNEANLLEEFKESSTLYTVPVCYEAPFALDIDEIAQSKNISVSKIIKIHTKPIYPVYFIGFLPGFPYLGGMSKKISHPRKASPRVKVSSGSVGIAGTQTGIYSSESPGGWNIIGRSPLNFFNTEIENPSLFKAGDHIRFESIDYATYKNIEEEVKSGSYSIQKKTYK
ncbi:5-oxoprolinase subunit PxpB [Brumimicrobium glaciale]|uniref:5-oxoprolinase subunit PxpB n=1 Tax=Brumimicrobium glaciale TaxID=200475 RepID=A0A4Q4KLK8_9FLAO|nr:5-oxoprolinase subunit PxpB [Brumimicrobium glaciale]RYM33938.1 5-oxoprolinase subunit PxpB [Brumimicrobium glaciale]